MNVSRETLQADETADLTTAGDYAIMETSTATPTKSGATTVEDLTKRTLSSIVEQKLVLEYQIGFLRSDAQRGQHAAYQTIRDYRAKIADLDAELERRKVTV